MAKKFKISEFESIFPTNLLEEGLDISGFNAEWKMEEGSDLVTATYSSKGIQPAKVTIHRTSTLVLSFTCNCIGFSATKGCKHVTGVFYRMKAQHSRLTPVNTSIRHSIDTYLEVTDREELNAFVKFFAANNSAFNKLFKQYFAYKSMAIGQDFEGHLQHLIRAHTDSKGKTSPGNRKLIAQIFELHLHRSDQLILHHEWQEAARVVMAILAQAVILAAWHPSTYNNYLVDKAHGNLKLITSQLLAPDLRRSIMMFIIQMIEKDNYQYHGPYNVVTLFLESQPDRELTNNMKMVLADKLKDGMHENTGKWLYYLYKLYASWEDFDLVSFYITYLVPEEHFVKFIRFCFDQHIVDNNIHRIIDFYLRQSTEQNPASTLKLIANYAITHHNGHLYKELFQRMKSQHYEVAEVIDTIHLHQAINNQEMAVKLHAVKLFEGVEKQFAEQYLQMVYMAGNIPFLLELLESDAELMHLKTYIVPLLEFDEKSSMDLILRKTKVFLTNHIGENSNKLIDDMIRKLIFAGRIEEARTIKSGIMDEFGDRTPLRNHLKSFAL